jgi:predicted RNA-binding Zn-ribbon protein involved in translation (DUF1610 family)
LDKPLAYIVFAVIFFLIVFLFKKVYLPRIKGTLGEYRVTRKLRRLNKNEYKVSNDIYLKANGRSIQIDHLVISIYGIFVIETKTYKGWIFGNEKSKYWTQTLYKKKYKFFNPVIQNWSHINFLKNISNDFKHLNYFSIIVFVGSAKLKRINASVPVIYKRKLLRTIRRNKKILLTSSQLGKIDNLLNQFIISKKEIKKAHKKYVKRNIKRNKKDPRPHICPKCGGKLVIRKRKYGDFYACSGFPECRFTKKK